MHTGLGHVLLSWHGHLLHAHCRSVAKRVFGEHQVLLADLTMASEDFAFMVSQR